ncbi:MAG: hypothetical protein IPO15_24150 [Anaerolineae bacterium]|uniref:hypothetical protein n=1 Tax=Candidatus Amarolinea dominans TaxID=3140696 RepID=UPI003136FB9F|nr:hypothetical protein [Anaerolineae bacterium]
MKNGSISTIRRSPRAVFSDTEVSSVHFDLVGSLAIVAGFSEADAAHPGLLADGGQRTPAGGSADLQLHSQQLSSAPPISSVMTDTFCPSPSTTAPTVTMGSLALVECPSCFTSRFGPYTIFFHFPHDRPDELQALRAWAFGDVDSLMGATFAYSGTYSYTWLNVADLFQTTPCFVTTTQTVDTGDVVAGSPPAFGVYLHSLGDNWSHGACIAAADANGLLPRTCYATGQTIRSTPVAGPATRLSLAIRRSSRQQSLLQCHLALYQEMIAFAEHRVCSLPNPIPADRKNNYLYNKLLHLCAHLHIGQSAAPAPPG